MSNLASLVSVAVRCSIRSPVSRNNAGSTCTSWHTSDKSFAVKSLTSLWRRGKFATGQVYHNIILSQNCCFVRTNPFSTVGSTNNHFDSPFPRFISFSLFLSFAKDSSKFCKKLLYRSFFSAFILLFSLKLQISGLHILDLEWWLSLFAVWWLSWNFHIFKFRCFMKEWHIQSSIPCRSW